MSIIKLKYFSEIQIQNLIYIKFLKYTIQIQHLSKKRFIML